MKNIITYITKLLIKLTNFGGNPKISRNRELTPSSIREPRLPDGQVKCPYCFSANYKKRGVRQKKLEQVQLYQCHDCQKTFTRQITKGKHYPLPIMFDAISIYNLGYSLEETCRIINKRNNYQLPITNYQSSSNDSISKQKENIENCELKINELPKLITGHIDILQIRNGQIHILDYKPNAEKERPIEQLTLYAMALSRLTGLRLFEFKCAWFDEKDYFEFFPLHVLHKPKKGRRRRKVYTMEGVYKINQEDKKISSLQPINKTNYVIH